MGTSVSSAAFLQRGSPEFRRVSFALFLAGFVTFDMNSTCAPSSCRVRSPIHKKWAEPTPGGRFHHFDEGTQNIMVYDQSEPLTLEALSRRELTSTARYSASLDPK